MVSSAVKGSEVTLEFSVCRVTSYLCWSPLTPPRHGIGLTLMGAPGTVSGFGIKSKPARPDAMQ